MTTAPELTADEGLESTSSEFDALFSKFGHTASGDAGEAERTGAPGDTEAPRVARARDYGWLAQDGNLRLSDHAFAGSAGSQLASRVT